MKIENKYPEKLPKKSLAEIENILDSLPKEHLRGIERIRLVDKITDPRLRNHPSILPGLYHPKQGTSQAWLEIAVESLLPKSEPLIKRLTSRLAFKNNLAAVITSLVGQHYYLTYKHSVKKSNLETSVRAYTEGHLRKMNSNSRSLRARLLKPIQPTLEKWVRSLQKQAAKSQSKANR